MTCSRKHQRPAELTSHKHVNRVRLFLHASPSFSFTDNHHILKITVKTTIWQSKKNSMFFFFSPDRGAFSHPYVPESKVLFQTQPNSPAGLRAAGVSTLRQLLDLLTDPNHSLNAWREIQHMAGLIVTDKLKCSWLPCEDMIRNSQAFQHISPKPPTSQTQN